MTQQSTEGCMINIVIIIISLLHFLRYTYKQYSQHKGTKNRTFSKAQTKKTTCIIVREEQLIHIEQLIRAQYNLPEFIRFPLRLYIGGCKAVQ